MKIRIAGKLVTIDYNKLDRYGHIIGKSLHNNSDINLQKFKRGLAWHYKKYEREARY